MAEESEGSSNSLVPTVCSLVKVTPTMVFLACKSQGVGVHRVPRYLPVTPVLSPN